MRTTISVFLADDKGQQIFQADLAGTNSGGYGYKGGFQTGATFNSLFAYIGEFDAEGGALKIGEAEVNPVTWKSGAPGWKAQFSTAIGYWCNINLTPSAKSKQFFSVTITLVKPKPPQTFRQLPIDWSNPVIGSSAKVAKVDKAKR